MAEVGAALESLPAGQSLEVVVCAFSDEDAFAYERALGELELGGRRC
jgi:hypothetical protein